MSTVLTASMPTVFSNLRARMARRALYKRTVKELSELSDQLLSDIGLSRLDIDRVAREAGTRV